MTIEPTVNGLDADYCCYIDGVHGQYAVDRLAWICEDYGLTIDDPLDDPRFLRRLADEFTDCGYGDSPIIGMLWEWRSECYYKLTDRLNEVTTGGVFHWQDGELFLSKHCDNDEEDCDDDQCIHAWP